MKFKGQDILSTRQFDKEGMFELFEEAREMEKVVARGGSQDLAGKIMATLFFEASTRTRFSFETAMLRLGGQVVSNADMKGTSSLRKFESLYDTGKAVSQMVDVLVVRHPEVGSVAEIARGSDVPVLNAGEGPAEHPTQGLLDVYTIWKEFGKLDGLKIGMMGDLKNSRVQHSQYDLLRHFDVEFLFNAPVGLEMPAEHAGRVAGLEELVSEADVISVSRVQVERFNSEEEYRKVAGSYVLDAALMSRAKKSAIVIQPLPRVDEVSVEVDSDSRARYFQQVANGVAVRMALLKKVLL